MEKQNSSERMELDATMLDLVVHLTQEQLNYKRPTLLCQRDPASKYLLNMFTVDSLAANKHDSFSPLQDQTPSSSDTDHKKEGNSLNG